jgi:hypothetical protein
MYSSSREEIVEAFDAVWVVKYSRFPEFFMPMCKSCHKPQDVERRLAQRRLFREWLQSQGQPFSGGDLPPF